MEDLERLHFWLQPPSGGGVDDPPLKIGEYLWMSFYGSSAPPTATIPIGDVEREVRSNLELEDSEDDGADEIDCHVAYRRPEVVTESYVYDLDSDDDDLPSHITERLAQIRALALEKYKEVHA